MFKENHSELIHRRIIEKSLISRFVEEALLNLFSEGKLYGTVHTCIGQEFVGSVVSEFLEDGDTIFSNHRCHGHFLSRHGDIDGLIAELMGKRSGVSGGLGGSQHLYKEGFFSNGIQGGIVPVAAGLALAHKYATKGNISVVFIGDGTLGEGVVYEALNIVSKWKLPLLVIVEDNKYSQSTAQQETLAGSIMDRATAFEIAYTRANTWDWPDFYAKAGALIEGMRHDSRPHILHIDTFRLKAHSKGDDTRDRSLVEPYELSDPLNIFLSTLSEDDQCWVDELKTRVMNAVRKADAESVSMLSGKNIVVKPVQWRDAQMPNQVRVVTELNRVFDEIMARDPCVLHIGEDILSPYGGAFKVTKGLSDRYPDRVRNTPISEAAIVGLGVGMGLLNYRPIVEIMFGDFIGLAFDQIVNHAAKFHQMYNEQINTNVIIRTPMGAGRGYGPTHSQTLDRHFLGVPGLRVLAMNHLTGPAQLYLPLTESCDGPSLVIENKLLYSSYLMSKPAEGFSLLHSDEKFPSAWIRPQSDFVDVTLIGYGGTSEILCEACEVLFQQHDLIAQAFCVMQIYPFSIESIADQILNSPNLVIVEEGQGFAGFGAEVIAQLAELNRLDEHKVRRIAPPAISIPSSGPMEHEYLPGVGTIVNTVLEMVRPC